MLANKKIAAVVVWYNPSNEVIENIATYGKCVDYIVCVDNSNVENSYLIQDERIIYVPLYKNTGIAHALNVGCNKVIIEGADILITFDQDTVCEKKTIYNLVKRLVEEEGNVIVAPNIKYIYREKDKRVYTNEKALTEIEEYPYWVITSGSAIKRETYVNVSGFDEKLFISQVYQDFCLRIYDSGGKIIRLADTYILQELGRTSLKKFIGLTAHVPNLSKERYFYIFRNERYLRRKWGRKYRFYKVPLYKYFISICFFETGKLEKLLKCMEGFRSDSL